MKLNKYIEIDLPDDVLQIVVKERKTSDITQNELAEWIGIDSTYLSKIENGKVDSIQLELFKLILKGIAELSQIKTRLKYEKLKAEREIESRKWGL